MTRPALQLANRSIAVESDLRLSNRKNYLLHPPRVDVDARDCIDDIARDLRREFSRLLVAFSSRASRRKRRGKAERRS